jgi:putative nucleotidyltransferase with HDIG domain
MENKDKTQLKKISIDDVEPGMVLEDVFNRDGLLLISNQMKIQDREQVETLKKQGVSSVYINVAIGKSLSNEKEQEISLKKREDEYYREISHAKEVHQATLEAARNTLSAVRMGKQIAANDIENATEMVVDSILRNPDALLSLAQIKGYDEYTYVHSVNVGILITSLANAMGYRKHLLLETGVGGLLHDVGKMRIPEVILNKAGKYTDEEFAVMKRHPLLGINILKPCKNISDFSKVIVYEHHERFNGKGYPRGISGSSISEIGVMAAVSDVYDAMTTDRVYRPAWTPQRALAMIFQGCDVEYSRRIVEFFTRHLGIYPVGSFVKLASGELGVVVKVDRGKILSPDVVVIYSSGGVRYPEPIEYKLSEKQKESNGALYRIEASLNPRDFGVNALDYINGPLFE